MFSGEYFMPATYALHSLHILISSKCIILHFLGFTSMPIHLPAYHLQDTAVTYQTHTVYINPIWLLSCLLISEGCLFLLIYLNLRQILDDIRITPANSILTKTQHRIVYNTLVFSLALAGLCAAIVNCWTNLAWGLYLLSTVLYFFFIVLQPNLNKATIFVSVLIGIGLTVALSFLLGQTFGASLSGWVTLVMVLVGWTMIMVANLSLIRLMEFITMNSECDERVVVFTEGVLSLAMAALLVYSKLNAGYQWSHLAGIWVGEFVLLMFVLLRKTKLWM